MLALGMAHEEIGMRNCRPLATWTKKRRKPVENFRPAKKPKNQHCDAKGKWCIASHCNLVRHRRGEPNERPRNPPKKEVPPPAAHFTPKVIDWHGLQSLNDVGQ